MSGRKHFIEITAHPNFFFLDFTRPYYLYHHQLTLLWFLESW